MNDEVCRDILEIVRKYAGNDDFDADSFVGSDLGILGSDFVELLYGLEDRFDVDLRPLVERGPLERTTIFHRLMGIPSRRSGVDVTVREIASFIKESRSRPHSPEARRS